MSGSLRQVNTLLEKVLGYHSTKPIYWSGITDDSRFVRPGQAFVALPSVASEQSSDAYIQDALSKGAKFIIKDSLTSGITQQVISTSDGDICCLAVNDLKSIHGELIARFYGYPSAQMTMVGVTGTNGKTSVINLIGSALAHLRVKCGLIGTLGWGVYNSSFESTSHTTPKALHLQSILHDLVNDDAQVCAMEVSSHAIDQARIGGVKFDIAILTNTSQDHLDYHGTMTAYRNCKAQLFSQSDIRHMVINLDDELGEALYLRGHAKADISAFSFKSMGARHDVAYCKVVDQSLSGQSIQMVYAGQTLVLKSSLTGQYNAENLVCAFLALRMMGYGFSQIIASLEEVKQIPGRFEVIQEEGLPTVIVDYAHTPDALRNVLITLGALTEGRVYVVFGCGGNRDVHKRPQMGMIAEKYADHVIITSDNPRDEDPHKIIDDIRSQMVCPWAATVESDRKSAMRLAMEKANVGDVILIAGKGHESFQVLENQRRLEHSDSDVVRHIFEEYASQ